MFLPRLMAWILLLPFGSGPFSSDPEVNMRALIRVLVVTHVLSLLTSLFIAWRFGWSALIGVPLTFLSYRHCRKMTADVRASTDEEITRQVMEQ